MGDTHQTYADWKAPRTDSELLIWPEPPALLRQTESNHAALAQCTTPFQGIPLNELRRRTRQWIGHDDGQLLIATGHQTELYHPGVWAKNALIHAAATAVGGQAYHFCVDTDEPKHLHLKWPGAFEPITDDENLLRAKWSGLVAPPTPAHVNGLIGLLADDARNWPFEPMLPQVLQSMRSLLLESENLPSLIVNACHRLDWDLGLRHHALILSPLWTTEPYLIYVHHLIGRIEQFARDYNAALDGYRADHQIKTPGRPMPDLAIGDNDIECPFWLDDLADGTRSRLHVQQRHGRWCLVLDGEAFAFDPATEAAGAADGLMKFLRRHHRRISPRALTLTLFMRLFLADNFVHGIGGGRYDQVLDRILAGHFGIEPPHFAVTTATLYFPTALGRQRQCLPCLRQQGHRLRHNVIGPRKRELVSAIAAAPRRSPERQILFRQMHQLLADARTDPAIQQWEQRWEEAVQRDQEDAVLFDRELFYAIQPRDRLLGLIDRYTARFA